MRRDLGTAFVTGATGFIGLHLVEHLVSRGTRVRCLVRSPAKAALLDPFPVERVEGDLSDPGRWKGSLSGVDALFHLGGLTAARDLAGYRRLNTEATRALGEAALSVPRPPGVFLFVSSLAAMGPRRDPGEVIGEDDPPRPLTDYGVSKWEAEEALRALPGLATVVVRPPAVYGPGDRELLPFFRLAAQGVFPVANRRASLSLVHVHDLARGLAEAAVGGRAGEAYHLAHPRALSPGELSACLARAAGRERLRALPVPYPLLFAAAAVAEAAGRLRGRVPVFNRQKARELAAPGWACSVEKARADFGFTADLPAEVGFAMTALWYRARGWM